MIAGITGMFALRDLCELLVVTPIFEYFAIVLSQLSEASFMVRQLLPVFLALASCATAQQLHQKRPIHTIGVVLCRGSFCSFLAVTGALSYTFYVARSKHSNLQCMIPTPSMTLIQCLVAAPWCLPARNSMPLPHRTACTDTCQAAFGQQPRNAELFVQDHAWED